MVGPRGRTLCFAYEEAIGYCVDPDAVRDKDGIGSAVLLAQIAARLRREGSSIASPARRSRTAARQPRHRRAVVARHARRDHRCNEPVPVRTTTNLGGIDCAMSDYANRDDGLRTDMVEFIGADGDARVRALVRPSGTEPKAKASRRGGRPRCLSRRRRSARGAHEGQRDLACAIANDLFGG